MKSDIVLFKEYDSLSTYNNKASNVFSWLTNTIQNSTYDMLDVNSARLIVNEIFDFLSLKKKFLILSKEVKGDLSFTENGFKVCDKVFSTLDEVEKAINNKAFL